MSQNTALNQNLVTVLQKSKFVVKLLVVGQHGAHHDVRMAVDVLGQRVHRQICAQLQRQLKDRRHERIINADDDVRPVHGANASNRLP